MLMAGFTVLVAGNVPSLAQPAAVGFVGRSGGLFTLNGQPTRFVGVNYYNAAGDATVYQCGYRREQPEIELDGEFRRIRAETGSSVVRFWAFQTYAGGGTNWVGIDRVMRLAQAHDLRVIPVLENQWADCTQGGRRTADWYTTGYQQPYGDLPLSYEAYVRRIVERYRDNPTVFAWMLMNEAEARRTDGSSDPDALLGFADRMSRLVREVDPNHLVGLGVMGRGQPGTREPAFDRLHAVPTLDFVTYHDYADDDAPLPGARLELAAFTQDQAWKWQQGAYAATTGQVWQTVAFTVPPAALPLHRLGLTMFGDFDGLVYIDQIEVGGQVFDFEDGTAGGWRGERMAAVEAVQERAASGSWSLRARVGRPANGAHLWLPAPEGIRLGDILTMRVLVDTPGITPPPHTLARAFTVARAYDKPLLVAEAGMTTCESRDGSAVQTPEGRAERFRAKMTAFFQAGGAGYLVWSWNPQMSCSYAFSSGDPLSGVLRGIATDMGSP